MKKMSAARYKRIIEQQHKAHAMQQEMKKKPKHGGKRKGSGRPKGEPTKTMRVPVSKVEEVNLILSRRSPDKSVGED